MKMIMIAGFVDSITTPIKSWIETVVNSENDNNTSSSSNSNMMRVKQEVCVDHSCRVDCIVCLSEVSLGEKFGVLETCRHGFHVECVEAWLKDHPNCPLCRTLVSVSGGDEKRGVYLKKVCEMMRCCGFRALETIASWLTKSFSQGLQSSLSESCTYL